ncbi:sugar-binding transcriptional regulator [Enterococcus sp. AZ109]|uniref:sugar-binding transcriptional regulator n=1 Tax=Enterococcus sp. AZ109 TaxID=2774634 RepID=UPI003F28D2BB
MTEKNKLLAKIAYMYYVEGMKQSEIAKELDIYRTSISRMLNQAKEEGIVEIKIHEFDSELYALETKLKKKFNLAKIEIVPTDDTDSVSEKEAKLSKAAAELIRKQVTDHSVVGLSWGASIGNAVSKIEKKSVENAMFVPIVGGPSHINSRYHVNTLVYEMARKFNGDSIFVNASVIQESKALAQGILNSNYFTELRDYWGKLDIAIVGVGGPLSYKKSQWRDLLTEEDIEDLALREAIGDCCCCFFDREGKISKGDLYNRRIGMPLEELAKVPSCIGIARGKIKAKSILALLKKRYINTLITDQETALEILRIAKEK